MSSVTGPNCCTPTREYPCPTSTSTPISPSIFKPAHPTPGRATRGARRLVGGRGQLILRSSTITMRGRSHHRQISCRPVPQLASSIASLPGNSGMLTPMHKASSGAVRRSFPYAPVLVPLALALRGQVPLALALRGQVLPLASRRRLRAQRLSGEEESQSSTLTVLHGASPVRQGNRGPTPRASHTRLAGATLAPLR